MVPRFWPPGLCLSGPGYRAGVEKIDIRMNKGIAYNPAIPENQICSKIGGAKNNKKHKTVNEIIGFCASLAQGARAHPTALLPVCMPQAVPDAR